MTMAAYVAWRREVERQLTIRRQRIIAGWRPPTGEVRGEKPKRDAWSGDGR